MKKVIFVLGLILIVGLMVVLSGCASKKEENTAVTIRSTDLKKDSNSVTNTEANVVENEEEETVKINYAEAAEKQMSKPEVGETIAIIKVKGFGEMKFKFFDEIAPKAVENFLTHAKEGYYDGLKFHRVIEEFMIQGGDPEGTGMGGESIWGSGFGTELDERLLPYRGSLCMAMSSLPNSIGSQYFITQANYKATEASYLKQAGYSNDLIEQYKKYGGSIYSLYMQYTVFGQMYEGFDVLDKIAKVEKTYSSSGELSVPVEDVIVEKITVTEYK